jgi:hypothetical protein
MTQEDGQLAIAKYYNGDNDPEEIGEALKEVYDRDCFLHFRYRTKGPVNSDSCHPFVIYDDNDRQLALMHNGTFSGYGTQDKVDSEDFGERIIAPLYDTFLKSGVSDPLNNPFFSQIVHKFTDTGSKVVLMDNLNKPLIINEKSGEIFTDQAAGKSFWISNKYSFNQSHRTPTTTTKGWASSYAGSFWDQYDGTTNDSLSSGNTTSVTTMGTAPVDNKAAKEVTTVPKRVERQTYWGDILKLDSIEDVLDMTFADVSDLIDLEPENAKLFINDLLWELYATTYETSEVDDAHEDEKRIAAEKKAKEEADLKAALDNGEHVYPSVETH